MNQNHQNRQNRQNPDQDFKLFIAQLKERLPVSEVVGQYVRLRREGREWKGLSPFTQEKTPSFTINDQKQFWHCFSSGKHGDVISFLTETQNMSFIEAVEFLAQRAGLEMPRRRHVDPVREKRRATARDALAQARDWFQEQLAHTSAPSRAARDYLEGRHLSQQTLKKFGVGFAPDDRSALRNAMSKAGFNDQALLEAGLVIKPEGGAALYDRFRGRIMFPIENRKGETIAFGARALDVNARAKYLNSPETELFHKGSTLYGLPQAMKPAYEQDEVIIVEGYMDVLALHDAGVCHAVASLGTALTEQQMMEAWRLAPEPIICLDGDEAGKHAAARVIERALAVLTPGKSLRLAYMPQGKDPDDLIHEEGRAAFETYLADAQFLSEALYIHETQNKRLDTPERKAQLQKRFDQLIDSIADPEIQRNYRREFRMRLDQLFWRMDRDRGKTDITTHGSAPRLAPDGASQSERILLGLLLAQPQLLASNREDIANISLIEPHRHLRDELLRIADQHRDQEMTTAMLFDALPAHFQHLLDMIYGRDENGQPNGGNFYRLFPSLSPVLSPEEDFIQACFDYFLRGQYHKAVREDYEQAARDYRAQMSEAARARFIGLKEEADKEWDILLEASLVLSESVDGRAVLIDWATLFEVQTRKSAA